MNQKELIKGLEQLDLPEVELPTHQHRLKMALLNSDRMQKRNGMNALKLLAPVGAIAAALVVVLGISYSGGTQTEAADIAAKSMQAIAQLSDVQKNALDAHLNAEADSLLAQAVRAKDLKAVSPEDVAGFMYPSSWMGALTEDERASFAARLASADLANAQFLQFTNDNGQEVIVAVNSENLPVYQIAGVGSKDADEAAGIRALVENFGHQLKFVSLLSPTAASDMAARYKEYVAPELLATWEADPTKALGRLTSSPWPEGIVVTGMHKTDSNTYTVEGKLLEVTSVEITQGAAQARPVTLTVKDVNGQWLIADASLQSE